MIKDVVILIVATVIAFLGLITVHDIAGYRRVPRSELREVPEGCMPIGDLDTNWVKDKTGVFIAAHGPNDRTVTIQFDKGQLYITAINGTLMVIPQEYDK